MRTFDNSDVAKDIEAVCSKCGESWHVIVAVYDGKIEQVQCKSCGGYHKYKPIARDRMTLKRDTKSAVAEGLAMRIVQGKVSPKCLFPWLNRTTVPSANTASKRKIFRLATALSMSNTAQVSLMKWGHLEKCMSLSKRSACSWCTTNRMTIIMAMYDESVDKL